MSVELYIYWRVPQAQLPLALDLAYRLQAALRERHPGLLARLLMRPLDSAADATLMEVYSHTLGVSEDVSSDIEALAAQHLAPLLPAPKRHVEVFADPAGA